MKDSIYGNVLTFRVLNHCIIFMYSVREDIRTYISEGMDARHPLLAILQRNAILSSKIATSTLFPLKGGGTHLQKRLIPQQLDRWSNHFRT